MKSTLSIFLLAGIVAADFEKHLIGSSSLWEREFCSGVSCAACYGPGNIICQSLGTVESCFNPSNGEQCCANGDYCVGADTSCCGSVGAGITLTAEPTASQSDSAASQTQSAPMASGSTWDCQPTDSNEQCCQRGGSINFWCSGEDPRQCYRPSLGEECCADGSVCQGSGCCVADGSSPTTPNPVEATSVPDSGSSSLNLNTGNAFPSQTSSSQTTRQLSIPGASTPTATGNTVVGNSEAAPRSVVGGAFAALVGFVGMALL